jgi:hypothetical protein
MGCRWAFISKAGLARNRKRKQAGELFEISARLLVPMRGLKPVPFTQK